MIKTYEQQILDWEQEIGRVERTIASICEEYIQLTGKQYTNMHPYEVKDEILFSAYLIRKNTQDQKDLIKEGDSNGE